MPDNPNLMDETKVPTNWVDAPAKSPMGAAAPPVPHEMPQYFSGSLAPQLQLDSAFSGTEMASPMVPKHSLMPFGNQASAFTNAASQSTSKIIVDQAIAAIPPPVTSTDTDTGDGLIHGDAIWEIDPAYILLRDDFINTDQEATLQSFVSEIPWYAINGGSPASVFNGGFQFPYNGIINLSNDGNSNRSSKILPHIETQPEQFGWPLLDYPGWKFIWVFGIGRVGQGSPGATFSWTQVSMYMGLANYPSLMSNLTATNTPRPPFFLGLRYDTDTTAPAISDTTFKFEYVQNLTATATTRINTQGTIFDTGMVATEGRKYRLEISCTTSGQVKFFFTDGVTTSSTTMTVTQFSSSTTPTVSISNGLGFYSTTDYLPWAPGSKATITGGVVAAFNTTLTMIPSSLQPLNGQFYMAGSQSSTPDTGAVTKVFPALVPFVSFGNDTQAAPTANLKAIQWDFISFVWNPGVGGGTGTPNSTLARYW
jgi:hypothetical protein